MKLEQIKGIVFDVDGSIIDALDYILLAFGHALKVHKIRRPGKTRLVQMLSELAGKQLKEYYEVLAQGKNAEELVRRHRDYQGANLGGVQPFPGTISTLEHLRSKQIKMVALSNRSRESVGKTLERTGLDGFFLAILAAEDVEFLKPAPHGVIRAMEIMGTRPEETMGVGDLETDIEAYRAAGAISVGATYGFQGRKIKKSNPDHIITDIRQLAEFF